MLIGSWHTSVFCYLKFDLLLLSVWSGLVSSVMTRKTYKYLTRPSFFQYIPKRGENAKLITWSSGSAVMWVIIPLALRCQRVCRQKYQEQVEWKSQIMNKTYRVMFDNSITANKATGMTELLPITPLTALIEMAKWLKIQLIMQP